MHLQNARPPLTCLLTTAHSTTHVSSLALTHIWSPRQQPIHRFDPPGLVMGEYRIKCRTARLFGVTVSVAGPKAVGSIMNDAPIISNEMKQSSSIV